MDYRPGLFGALRYEVPQRAHFSAGRGGRGGVQPLFEQIGPTCFLKGLPLDWLLDSDWILDCVLDRITIKRAG